MSYKVTLYHADSPDQSISGITKATKFYMSRSQAIHGMRKLAYDRLSSFAMLDTQAAHDVMAAIDRCDDILQPQECRNVTISNTGYQLTISNTARMPR